MAKSKPKPRRAQAGDNHPPRTLDDIAGEIRSLERNNAFAIGKLLDEAEKGQPGEYGQWMDWLDQFDFSHSTADNYRDAHKLSTKFPTIVNLKVPMTVIYDLAAAFLDEDDDNNIILRDGDRLEAIVQDLDKAAKSAERPLRVADCNRIIAEKIWGPLPAWLDAASLDRLHSSTFHPEVLEKLNEAESPLTDRQIGNLIHRLRRKAERAEQQGGTDEHAEGDEQERGDEEQDAEVDELAERGDEEQDAETDEQEDIGAGSRGEIERLMKAAIEWRDREIQRLQAELKDLKGADLPTLTTAKHIEALTALLKKVSREAQELAVEDLCRKLKLDPHKLSIKSEAAPTEHSASEASSSNGPWLIKPTKYVNGWSWFATNGSSNLNSKPGTLFATEVEAQADARAAIARHEQGAAA
jgi:hypothetical protein